VMCVSRYCPPNLTVDAVIWAACSVLGVMVGAAGA